MNHRLVQLQHPLVTQHKHQINDSCLISARLDSDVISQQEQALDLKNNLSQLFKVNSSHYLVSAEQIWQCVFEWVCEM